MELLYLLSERGDAYVTRFIESFRDEKIKAKLRTKIKLLKDWDFDSFITSDDIVKLKGRNLNLYEFKISFNRNEYRIIFLFKNNICYLVHAFQKKDQKTRSSELELAENRARLIN